jgi:hypothetical protein
MSKQPAPKWRDYPPPADKRVGCKVAWYSYADKADAEACAKAAKWNASIQRGRGYDFGYCCPGDIEQRKDGLFEVCLP